MFADIVDLSASNANSFSWVKAGEQVEENASYQFDGSDVTVVATLGFNDLTQKIIFYVGASGDAPAPPSDLVFGELENGRLYTSWIDHAVGEIGYKVYYRVDDGDWRFADSVVSSPEVSATTGTLVERTAIGVNTANSYTFKVCAYGLDSKGNEIESDGLQGVYTSTEFKLDSPTNFIAYDYNPETLTLQTSWDKVDGAAYYEVNTHSWTKFDVNEEPGGYMVVTNFTRTGRPEDTVASTVMSAPPSSWKSSQKKLMFRTVSPTVS